MEARSASNRFVQLQSCKYTPLTGHGHNTYSTCCSTDRVSHRWCRQHSLELLQKERLGITPPDKPSDDIYFTNDPSKCPSRKLPAVINNNCPHPNHWMYLTSCWNRIPLLENNFVLPCQNSAVPGSNKTPFTAIPKGMLGGPNGLEW